MSTYKIPIGKLWKPIKTLKNNEILETVAEKQWAPVKYHWNAMNPYHTKTLKNNEILQKTPLWNYENLHNKIEQKTWKAAKSHRTKHNHIDNTIEKKLKPAEQFEQTMKFDKQPQEKKRTWAPTNIAKP